MQQQWRSTLTVTGRFFSCRQTDQALPDCSSRVAATSKVARRFFSCRQSGLESIWVSLAIGQVDTFEGSHQDLGTSVWMIPLAAGIGMEHWSGRHLTPLFGIDTWAWNLSLVDTSCRGIGTFAWNLIQDDTSEASVFRKHHRDSQSEGAAPSLTSSAFCCWCCCCWCFFLSW